MNLSNLSVSTRLAWGFGTLLAMLMLVVAAGILRMGSINAEMTALISQRIPATELINDTSYRVVDNARVARNMILHDNDHDKGTNKDAYDKNLAVINENLNNLASRINNAQDKALFDEVSRTRAAYESYTDNVIALALAHRSAEATALLFSSQYQRQGDYLAALGKLRASQKQLMESDALSTQELNGQTRDAMLAVGFIALLLGVGLTWLITRSIRRQLGGEPRVAVQIARAVAQGDLTHAILVKDGDTGSLIAQLQQMQLSLAKVVGLVRGGVESVTVASMQIAAGNRDLSSRIEMQASSLKDTASAMEQISGTVHQSADVAQQASRLADAASQAASGGGLAVEHVVHRMNEISSVSQRIGEVIGVIDGIAFQTNILALNAAIEAARAGAQGKGFAVVAAEVRTLARNSAEAAREIKQLVEDSADKVDSGSVQVADAGQAMGEIVDQVGRVNQLIGELASAAREQSMDVEQISDAVAQMDRTVQQNASLVEQSASAAIGLEEQAKSLARAVEVFKVPDHCGVGNESALTGRDRFDEGTQVERELARAVS